MGEKLTREKLDLLYAQWNKPEYISPDPLETVVVYNNLQDREVAGLLASSMAYGRVAALLVPLKKILGIMGSSPADFVSEKSEEQMFDLFEGIIHRFAAPAEFAALLAGSGAALRKYGSLESVLLKGYLSEDGATDIIRGLKYFTDFIKENASGNPGHLLPDPLKGSACKRLLLYLRWMVRNDSVDPGGWNRIRISDLLLPLDTWTYRISLRAGWTERKSADMKTVIEVSRALAEINPEDPVKYDFSLSRFGIRSALNPDLLFKDYPELL